MNPPRHAYIDQMRPAHHVARRGCISRAGVLLLVVLSALTPIHPACADRMLDMGLDLPKKGIPDRVSVTKALPPNTKTVYAQLEGPGVIRHIWMTPTNQF